MITSIELENVRIFEGSGWKFPLRPLTIFCGTNSCGKSTILRTLLLLQQSQGIGESYRDSQPKLWFVSNQIDFGNYAAFVSHKDTDRTVSLSVTVEDTMPLRVLRRLRSLNTDNKTDPDHESSKASEDDDANISYTLRSHFDFEGECNEQPKEILPSDIYSIEDNEQTSAHSWQGVLKSASYEAVVNGEKLLSWNVARSTTTVAHNDDNDISKSYDTLLLPRVYVDSLQEYFGTIKFTESEYEGFVQVQTDLRGLLPDVTLQIQLQPFEELSEDVEQAGWVFFRPSDIHGMIKGFRRTLLDIRYLRPLRSSVRRYYLAEMDPIPTIDTTGKYLPYVLREQNLSRSQMVWNIPPGQESDAREETLFEALTTWLYYFRTGDIPMLRVSDETQVSTTKNVLLEWEIKSVCDDQSYAMIDSGFGYSQILPIVVEGLRIRPGDTLIIEQPELHLNPALQVRLAEFFVAMVRTGKQIIIETHSEHIVDMIRVLAAEDESDELASLCGILFIDVESGRPVVHDLSIKPDGTVPEWPSHFFGEALSLSGRLLRAQKKVRKNQKVSA